MVHTEINEFTGLGIDRRNHKGVLVPAAMRAVLDKVLEDGLLPHGSGIDMDWIVEGPNTRHCLRLLNSYHCMDEWGFYRKWQDFQVRFFRHKLRVVRILIGPMAGKEQVVAIKGHWDWKLKWCNEIVRTAYSFGLQDYLQDTLCVLLEPLCRYANGFCTWDHVLLEMGIKKENIDSDS